MTDPTPAVKDPKRLAALHEADLLDTPPEEVFDQMIRLASRLLDAPTALVSLVDEDRQFFKACIGVPQPWFDTRETPLSHSFCQYVVADREPLIVEDAREHPVLRTNLAVSEVGVIAYLGVPLFAANGQALGSLCVIDSKPRRWNAHDIDTLTSLAASVMSTIDLRSVARAAVRQADAAAQPGNRSQAAPDVEGAHAAAEVLWDDAARFLELLDAYDRLIRNYRLAPDSLAEEAKLRDAIRDARKRLQQTVEEFDSEAEQLGEVVDPVISGASALRDAISEYCEAESRRGEANLQFQQLAGPLEELERAHALAARAEGRLRQAATAYESIR